MAKQVIIGLLLMELLAITTICPAQTISDGNSKNWQQTLGFGERVKTVQATFLNPVEGDHTVIVMVAYGNRLNRNKLSISGLGATWQTGYITKFKRKIGIAFFYGSNIDTSQPLNVTVTAPHKDDLVMLAGDWANVSVIEDPAARALTHGHGSVASITGTTSNPNDVVLNFVAYSTRDVIFPSPPSSGFLNIGIAGNTFPPFVAGAYSLTNTAGGFQNSITMSGHVKWVSASIALESTNTNSWFAEMPLTDYSSSQLYLGLFPGFLYQGGNTPTTQHDADGRNAASSVQPVDSLGSPSASGKFGVVAIGVSNFTEEFCTGNDFSAPDAFSTCDPNSFMDQAAHLSTVNPNMVLADCAQGGAYAPDWADSTLSSTAWTTCLTRLSNVYNLTPAQVQVVVYEAGENSPTLSLINLRGSTCPAVPNAYQDPDACLYAWYSAQLMRILRTEFPNLKQVFLQQRIYAGFGDREPFSYELGFAIKWLIQAQTNQIATGTIDPLAGDLSYQSAPWLGWSAYTWGAGPIPRADGEVWLANNYEWDGIHPSQCRFDGIACGRQHSATLMMNYFTSSPYSTWFSNPN